MAADRWDPFQDLLAIQKRMNRLFESALTGASLLDSQGPVGWRPAADVIETDQAVEITLELAGLRREDIHIEVGDETLTVHGERRPGREADDGRFFQLERSYGPFVRQFRIPDAVSRDAIEAQYRSGILNVVLPKRADAGARPVRVVVD